MLDHTSPRYTLIGRSIDGGSNFSILSLFYDHLFRHRSRMQWYDTKTFLHFSKILDGREQRTEGAKFL